VIPANILLVEDDRALLEGIADLLEVSDTGYDVLVSKASDGEMGLNMVAKNEPDLIISDIMMPRMGGFEFLERLRERSEWIHIPVIFLTARGTAQDILKGRVSGAELYITKPYDSDELIQLVNSQLNRTFQLREDRQRQIDLISRNIINLLNHEFRTPLTYVTAYRELLSTGMGSEEVANLREYLQGIQVGTTRLNRLVGNLVQVMRLRTGQATQSIGKQAAETTQLADLLHAYVEQLRRRSTGQPIAIHTRLPATLPRLYVDLPSLFYAIDCVMDNAVKFSRMRPDQTPKIILSAESNAQEITLSINDNGIGLGSDVYDRVFDLFYQHDREEMEQQGAGLGLAIAKGLVEINGGRIAIESADGIGCTVSISLPVVDKGAALLSPEPRKSRIKYHATILLVEDEVHLLDGLSELLGLFKSGYQIAVLKARDGQEALQIMDQCTPDLIVSDIMMPRMDGYELLNRIRENPAWVTIPFIFLTAKGDRQDMLRGRSIGAEEYITKPYHANELFSLVLAQLDRHFHRQDVIRQDFEELKRNVLDLLVADIEMPLNMVSESSKRLAKNLEIARSEDELMLNLEALQDGSEQITKIVEEYILLVELRTAGSVDWFSSQAQVSDINKLLIEWEKLWLVSHGPSVVKIRLELTSGIQQVMIDPGLFRYCLNRLVESTLASQDLQHPLRILLASNQIDGQAEIFITIFGVDRSAEDVEKIRLLLAKEESIIPELFEFDPSLLITKGIICYYEGSIDLESLGGRGTMIRISLPIVYTEN
jgi:DNA-binding response OmpR family regulator